MTRADNADCDAVSRLRAMAMDSEAEAMIEDALAQAWDEGYHRGVRDEAGEMEPADNPYRTRVTTPVGGDQ